MKVQDAEDQLVGKDNARAGKEIEQNVGYCTPVLWLQVHIKTADMSRELPILLCTGPPIGRLCCSQRDAHNDEAPLLSIR